MGRIRTLHGYVLIEPLGQDESSGIVSPSSVNLSTYTGKVLAVGTGTPDGNGSIIPMKVAVGDIVHFDNTMSKRKEIELEGKTFYYMDQLAIFAVVEDENEIPTMEGVVIHQ